MLYSNVHIDIGNINHKVALKIKGAMRLSPMCVPINTSNSPKHTKVIYATKRFKELFKDLVNFSFVPPKLCLCFKPLLPWPNDCRVFKIVRQRGPP